MLVPKSSASERDRGGGPWGVLTLNSQSAAPHPTTRRCSAASARATLPPKVIPMPRSSTLPAVVFVVVAAACTRDPAPTRPIAKQSTITDDGHGHDAAPTTTTKSAAFLFPQDGSTVFADVDLALRVSGMELKRAGVDPADPGSGHHHLIVDAPSVPAGEPVPRDERHLHFDDGGARVSVRLPVGAHALEMQFADGEHRSYGPALAARIRVNVVATPPLRVVSFVNVKDGATLSSPARLELSVEGFPYSPPGTDVLDKTRGHFHVIVDDDPVLTGTVIPDDGTHMMCARAARELTVPLSPGPHSLTVQLADAAHASYGPRLSTTIKVRVQ